MNTLLPLTRLTHLINLYMDDVPIAIDAVTLKMLLQAWPSLLGFTLLTSSMHPQARLDCNDLALFAEHGRCLRHIAGAVQNPPYGWRCEAELEHCEVSWTVRHLLLSYASSMQANTSGVDDMCYEIFPAATIAHQ